jgi:hypothetical protein
MTARVNGSRNLHSLIVNETLAAIHEVFPLRAPALHDFLPTLNIFDGLAFATLDENVRLVSHFTRPNAHILRAVLGSGYNVLAGLATALRRVQNTNQCANPKTCKEPSKCLLIIRCHEGNSFRKNLK